METVAGDSSVRCTKTRNGWGRGSPSCWETEGFSRSKREGTCVQAGAEAENAACKPRRTSASARSSTLRAEFLKSRFEGSTTAKYRLGFRNCSSELLSKISVGDSP